MDNIGFGRLTTQAGQQIKFENFDKNSDGTITEEEYNAALQEYGLDSVELSKVDTDGNKEVSNEEFQVWEQKIKMEEALAPYITKVTTDFIGANSAYAGDMTTALRNYVDTYAETYMAEGNNVTNLATDFAATLETKYAELKEEVLYDTPEAAAEREAVKKQENASIKSTVLDTILQEEKAEVTKQVRRGLFRKAKSEMDDNEAAIYEQKLGAALEKEADKFIAGYTGANLAADLETHLREYLASSERSKLETEIADWERKTSGSEWNYIDSGELETLKGYAKELLNAAIEKGFTVSLGGYNYTNVSALEEKIDAYTDGASLKEAVQKFIDSLETESVEATTKSAAVSEAEAAEQAAFAAISSDAYQVDTTTIDFSSINGYYDDATITVKGKSDHDANIQDEAKKRIEESDLKDQMWEQVLTMLNEQGISSDSDIVSTIKGVFENVYADSLNDTLSSITSYKSKHKVLNKKKEYTSNEGMQTIVQNFLSTFNTNIANAISEMNTSKTDMDTQDINLKNIAQAAGVDKDVQNAVEEDRTAITNDIGEQAEALVDALESTLLRKAKSMCSANDVTFDEKIFNTMFNNAKGKVLSDDYVSIISIDNMFVNEKYAQFNPRTVMSVCINEFQTNYTEWVEKQSA